MRYQARHFEILKMMWLNLRAGPHAPHEHDEYKNNATLNSTGSCLKVIDTFRSPGLPSLAYSQSTVKPTSTIASSGGKAHSESYTDHKPACPLILMVHSNRRLSRRARRRPPTSLAPNAPTVPDSPKFAVHRLPIEFVFCLVYRPSRMPSRLARSRLRCPSHRTS